MTGLQGVCKAIYDDLKDRFPTQRATQRRKLSELSTAVLMCQSPNLMEISNVLDRPTDCDIARYNYVERFLKNSLVDIAAVMAPYAKDLLQRLAVHHETLVFMMDQSKVNDHLEMLMVSVRLKERALPLLWCVKETKGGIGFEDQKKLLDEVRQWLPPEQPVMLAADRFYGSAALIQWCQDHQWGYRLRLKSHHMVYQAEGSKKSLGTLQGEGVLALEDVRLAMGVTTSIGLLHEKGHPEPWFIAMDTKPTPYRVLDYGMRWGIEGMFSDFKSRGFCLTETQIRTPDRLERLLLVISIAFHWAVSVGLFLKKKDSPPPTRRQRKAKDPVSRFLKLVSVNSNDVLLCLKHHRLYGSMETDGC